ncbi:hypothetical protein [Streptomyces sp. NPDC003480]
MRIRLIREPAGSADWAHRPGRTLESWLPAAIRRTTASGTPPPACPRPALSLALRAVRRTPQPRTSEPTGATRITTTSDG